MVCSKRVTSDRHLRATWLLTRVRHVGRLARVTTDAFVRRCTTSRCLMLKSLALGQGAVAARLEVQNAKLAVLVWKKNCCFLYCAALTPIVRTLITVVKIWTRVRGTTVFQTGKPVILATVHESTLIFATKYKEKLNNKIELNTVRYCIVPLHYITPLLSGQCMGQHWHLVRSGNDT